MRQEYANPLPPFDDSWLPPYTTVRKNAATGSLRSIDFYGAEIKISNPADYPVATNRLLSYLHSDMAILALSAVGMQREDLIAAHHIQSGSSAEYVLDATLDVLQLSRPDATPRIFSRALRDGRLRIRTPIRLPHEANPGIEELPEALVRIIGVLASGQTLEEADARWPNTRTTARDRLEAMKEWFQLKTDAAAITFGLAAQQVVPSGLLTAQRRLHIDTLSQTAVERTRSINWKGARFEVNFLGKVPEYVSESVVLAMFGRSNAMVAAERGLQPRTVRQHISDVKRQFGVTTRFPAFITMAINEEYLRIKQPLSLPEGIVSERQTIILQRLAEGKTLTEAVQNLNMSEFDMKNASRDLKNIFNVDNARGIVIAAYASGVLSPKTLPRRPTITSQ